VIVIDASSLSAYILREEGSEEIAKHLREVTTSIELVAKETANAIVMAERKARVNKSQADAALIALRMLVDGAVRLHEQKELLVSSFEISRRENITVYDSVYIALAKKLGARLLTRDDTQAKAARSQGVSVVKE
jgi:predicted nucleic acid-binding protein